jgi:beta-glucosidase-like glycosyl hydrolase
MLSVRLTPRISVRLASTIPVKKFLTLLDDRTLHELYLWPFAEAVRANVGAAMTAYNRVSQSQAYHMPS